MSGTNPGAWPDQERVENVIMTTPELFGQMVQNPPTPVGPLYTAAEMKAARLETVERVVRLVAETDYIPGAYQWDKFGEQIEKLKEEIENE